MALGVVVAVVAAVVAAGAAMLIALGANTPAAAQDTGTGTELDLVDQTTWVGPDGQFDLRLQLTGAPAGAEVTVALYDAVPNRISYTATLDPEPSFPARLEAPEVVFEAPGPAPAEVPATIALQSEPTEADRVWLSEAGVYPVQVEVTHDGEVLDELVTHLIREPAPDDPASPGAEEDGAEEATVPLTTSVVLPLHAPPALNPDGTTELDDDARARLATVIDAVAAHPEVPLVLEPTPETVDALAQGSAPGDVELLDRLRSATGASQVLATPYVRLDLGAWLDAGLDDQLTAQLTRGAAVVDQRLARADPRTWVADEGLGAAELARLSERGADQVVLPEAALAPLDQGTFPTTLVRPFRIPNPLGVPQLAIQADALLQGHLEPGDQPVLAGHQLLADLAVLYFDRPDLPHGAAVVPPQGWDPDRALLGVVLDGLATSTILEPATADELFARVPPATTEGQAADPSTEDGAEVLVREVFPAPSAPLGDYPVALASTRADLASYQGMLATDNPRAQPIEERILVSGSSDLGPGQRETYLSAAVGAIAAELSALDAPNGQSVTLTAREGEVPLTLRNELGYPVDVVVRLDSTDRLTFPEGDTIAMTLDEEMERISLQVRARTSGDSPLRVEVTSPDGRLTVTETQFRVRSTAVSGVGLVLTVGAGLFLALWWARHFRSVRRARELVPAPAHPSRSTM